MIGKFDIVLYLNEYQYKEVYRYTFHTIKNLQTNYDLKWYYSLIIYIWYIILYCFAFSDIWGCYE